MIYLAAKLGPISADDAARLMLYLPIGERCTQVQMFPSCHAHLIRQTTGRIVLCLCLLAAGLGPVGPLSAITVDEMRSDSKMSPKRFAGHFAGFAYEFSGPIQPAETFLARKKGDCDDYSVLADHVLVKHGYRTRLIHVRLTGRVAHAVCYVVESKAYLDYNNRNVFFTLTKSGSDLRGIAAKVAQSLEASWTSASEFTYSYESRRKTMIATVSQTGVGAVPAPPTTVFNVD